MTSGNTAKLFQAIDETLDDIALVVSLFVEVLL